MLTALFRPCLFLLLAALAVSPAATQAASEVSTADWHGIRAAHEVWQRRIESNEAGGFHSFNPSQRWNLQFDQRGFVAAPAEESWQWGLELLSYGFKTAPVSVRTSQAAIVAAGERLTYAWDNSLYEWYVNGENGLQHGFTVVAKPPGAANGAPLILELAVRGGLVPEVDSAGAGVRFVSAETGAATLTYGGLRAWDADGRELVTRMRVEGQDRLLMEVEETGARYPILIDPVAQQAYLKASNTGMDDGFGISVAISGDTVVVGATGEDSDATGVNGDQANDLAAKAGAAYVFVRTGASWSQQAYLKASNTGADDRFGWSVGISGDTIVIAARQEDSAASGVDGNSADNSSEDSGAVYVFTRTGTNWSQQAYLKASNPDEFDCFGESVAISGDTILVGADFEDSNASGVDGNQANNSATHSGAAYVFTRDGTNWSQQAYLKASNTGASDNFGGSVAISGDTLVVGAIGEDSSAADVNGNQADNSASTSGAAYVFVRDGTTWSQQAYLKASNSATNDNFSNSLGISGDTIAVGARFENANAIDDAGAAYVFTRSGTSWSQQAYLTASNPGADHFFGNSLGLSGDNLVVSANWEDSSATGIDGDQEDDSLPRAGAAYLFVREGGSWSQRAYLKASNTGTFDTFGDAVAVSGDSIVVGAVSEKSNATGVNGDQGDDSASSAGAAYLFGTSSDSDPDSIPANSAPTIRSLSAPRASSTAKTRIKVRCSTDATKLLYRIKRPGQSSYGALKKGRAADGVGSLMITTGKPGIYLVSVSARDSEGLKSRPRIVGFVRVTE